MKLKVGVTGGIGSGKSLICDTFRHLGVPVFIADIESKTLVNTNSTLRQKLVAAFGEDTYTPYGINKERMAALIFNNTDALRTMNSIVHPFLKERFHQWLEQNSKKDYSIMEAAILFESGSDKEVDKIVTVFAPEEIRIKRVMDRDGMTIDRVKSRMRNQMGEEEKIKRSDYVIVNDGIQMVLPQVLKLHEIFRG